MIRCTNCGDDFEPVRTRWLCPRCGWKESCCEGEPQGVEPAYRPAPRPGSAAPMIGRRSR